MSKWKLRSFIWVGYQYQKQKIILYIVKPNCCNLTHLNVLSHSLHHIFVHMLCGWSHKSWCIFFLRQWGTNPDFCRFLVIYINNLLLNQYKNRTGFIFPGCSTCSKNGSESTVSERREAWKNYEKMACIFWLCIWCSFWHNQCWYREGIKFQCVLFF